jgi:hypothetical protein
MIKKEGKYICINDKHEFDHLIKGDIYDLKLYKNFWTILKNDEYITSFRYNSIYNIDSFDTYFRSLQKEERKLKLKKINESRWCNNLYKGL